jgi:hypothetical protein
MDFEIENDGYDDYNFVETPVYRKKSTGFFASNFNDDDGNDDYNFEVVDTRKSRISSKKLNDSNSDFSYSSSPSPKKDITRGNNEDKKNRSTSTGESATNGVENAFEKAQKMLSKYSSEPQKGPKYVKKKYSTDFDEDDISIGSSDGEIGSTATKTISKNKYSDVNNNLPDDKHKKNTDKVISKNENILTKEPSKAHNPFNTLKTSSIIHSNLDSSEIILEQVNI